MIHILELILPWDLQRVEKDVVVVILLGLLLFVAFFEFEVGFYEEVAKEFVVRHFSILKLFDIFYKL